MAHWCLLHYVLNVLLMNHCVNNEGFDFTMHHCRCDPILKNLLILAIAIYRVDHKVGYVGANKKTFLIIAEIF
jgi:hypothetical protein